MSSNPELDIINNEVETLKSTFEVFKLYLEHKFSVGQGFAITPEYIQQIIDMAIEQREKFENLCRNYRDEEPSARDLVQKTTDVIYALTNIENECYSVLIPYNNQEYKVYVDTIRFNLIPALNSLSYSI